MFKNISDWVHRYSNSWFTVSVLIIFALFVIFVLPDQTEKFANKMGNMSSPDTSFIYSTNDLYNFAEVYGQEGRQAYVKARFSFDLIFPVVYGLFLITSISWVYTRTFPENSLWQRINLIPIAGVAFDYLENCATSLIMIRYPAKTAVIDWLAPRFTFIKWFFVIGSFFMLLLGLIVKTNKFVKAAKS